MNRASRLINLEGRGDICQLVWKNTVTFGLLKKICKLCCTWTKTIKLSWFYSNIYYTLANEIAEDI